eukprot:CAMPEP_0167776634 /NCGR_PEP_ID=MMETSP0111_2-20121227/3234_1 /TAXON_ID=91324 /ORGANISM="Lotharella globosa, Strain CCCM811" /LENGTH=106 /DNA_ID=CAMNT_0007666703 /DNA_START=30 /DNA_END=350 /DNA_ORIENTATION=-
MMADGGVFPLLGAGKLTLQRVSSSLKARERAPASCVMSLMIHSSLGPVLTHPSNHTDVIERRGGRSMHTPAARCSDTQPLCMAMLASLERTQFCEPADGMTWFVKM